MTMRTNISIATLGDIEAIRVIRNGSRFFMTGDTGEIDPKTQALWWGALPASWGLYVQSLGSMAIGYGLVISCGGSMLTGAISEPFRGLGYGRELFGFMIDNSPGPHRLEVRSDNGRAAKLYRSLGFVETGTRLGGAILLMERP